MSFFLMLVQMIPSLIAIVKEIEKAIPGEGKGSQKLDMVLNTVNVAAQATPEIVAAVSNRDLNGAVTGIVNGVVKGMNASGAFKPATPTPAP